MAYIWLLLLNVYLISPVVLYDLSWAEGGSGLSDPVAIWNLGLSVMGVAGLQVLARRPLRFHLLILPFHLVVAVDLFLVFCFKGRLTTSYLDIIIGESDYALDFVDIFLPQIAAVSIAFVAFYVLALWHIRRLSFTLARRWGWAALAGVLVLYGGAIAKQMLDGHMRLSRACLDVATHDRSSPFGITAQVMVYFALLHQASQNAAERENFVFNAWMEPDDQTKVYVLVLGESARPDHWSLNGYHRTTSPRLDRHPNILSFSDIISEATSTRRSVPIILTTGTAETFERSQTERSIISAFSEVGFTTHWYSTQTYDHWTGQINWYAGEAEYRRYFERRLDVVLLDALDMALANRRNNKTFVVLHTTGSHMSFRGRYPAEFRAFYDSGADRRSRLINAYDNTILYTDYFLAEVIDRLDSLDVVSTMLYVSDHGQNLMDEGGQLVGHAIGNQFDLPVPMFLWYSDEFESNHPALVRNGEKNVGRRMTTATVFHTLLEIAEINVDVFDPRLSAVNEQFEERPRLVEQRGELIDYDEWIASQ